MTVNEMLYKKYLESLKTMNRAKWENIKLDAKSRGVHPAEIMYMGLEITVNDIRKNGGWTGELWKDIQRMHSSKLLASNSHRQYSGHVTAYWLTRKGWAEINADHEIC